MLPLLRDQARAAQLGEVEGQRAVGDVELLGDRSRRQSFLAGLDQQAEQGQSMLLGQGAKRDDGGVHVNQRKFAHWRQQPGQQGVGGGEVQPFHSAFKMRVVSRMIHPFEKYRNDGLSDSSQSLFR